MSSPEDKANEWAKQMADMAEGLASLWRFYEGAVAQGFTEEQAMELVIAVLTRSDQNQ